MSKTLLITIFLKKLQKIILRRKLKTKLIVKLILSVY